MQNEYLLSFITKLYSIQILKTKITSYIYLCNYIFDYRGIIIIFLSTEVLLLYF